jgi:hypothetical protein
LKAKILSKRGYCILGNFRDRRRYVIIITIALGLVLASTPAMSQDNGGQWGLINGNLQERVNGVPALMGYTVFPDVTISHLSITNSGPGNPAFRMAQLGGGFTVSKPFPLYREGNTFSRYDPTFIATNGAGRREVPVGWTTVTGTVGVVWDFPLARELVLRPIANFPIGRLTSDVSAAHRIIGAEKGQENKFLENAHLNASGFDGSLILGYERCRESCEIDVELRYANIYLQSIPGMSEGVQGSELSMMCQFNEGEGSWRRPIEYRYIMDF